jgi:hypothetical protein
MFQTKLDSLRSLLTHTLAFVSMALMASCSDSARDTAPLASTGSALTGCVLGDECCPQGYTQVTLTSNSDVYSASAANRCVKALGGSDVITANVGPSVVLAGDGDDTIMAGPAAVVRGGAGNDTINAWGGAAQIYGGSGNDTIMAANGDNLVVPGPGNDTVYGGTGNDTVAIYAACEVTGFKKILDGGGGFNTLITPFSVDELRAKGFTVTNFQDVRIQQNSCKSECVVKPDCSGHGTCREDTSTGQLDCRCDRPFVGDKCETACESLADTDRDGVLDCQDPCPLHPAQTPGRCGCGVSETHSDNDGIPDCLDQCPKDDNNVFAGECGCVGEANLKPAGTPCGDVCPGQPAATCDGAGRCGNPDVCKPASTCVRVTTLASTYWICGFGSGAKSFSSAWQTCKAKGMALAQIDTYDENQRLLRVLPGKAWLGANEASGSGRWFWTNKDTRQGVEFWSEATRAPIQSRFAAWSQDKLPSGQCAAMRTPDGRWLAEDCAKALPYVCEYSPPEREGPLPDLNLPHLPVPADSCDLEQPGQPTQLPAQDDLAALQNAQDQAANENFIGPAQGAVRGSACPQARASESCARDQVTVAQPVTECEEDKNCAGTTRPSVCRKVKEDPGCVATLDKSCDVVSRCVELNCPEANPEEESCGQVEICGAANSEIEVTVPTTADLPETAVPPAAVFPADAGAPVVTPSVAYEDPVVHSDPDPVNPKRHSWCSMKPQNPANVKEAVLPTAPAAGNSKGGADENSVEFNFDPDVVFKTKGSPLGFGETKLSLTASAQMQADVDVTLFGKPYKTKILDALAEVRAERCRVWTSGSHFKVFDHFVSNFLPSFDTNTNTDTGRICDQALARYEEAADRVKKAFRDAEQLLRQYHQLNGLVRFGIDAEGKNLCEQLGVASQFIPNFPGGNECPIGEPAEVTINRFIFHFQDGDGNALDGLRSAGAGLSGATDLLRQTLAQKIGDTLKTSLSVPFGTKPRGEARPIFDKTVFIGPIPINMEVDVATKYGVNGGLEFGLQLPTKLGEGRGNLDNPKSPVIDDIANVLVTAEPYAAAGLSVFAGIGGGVGPLKASAGIEGALTLARLSVPVHAGAGLGVATTVDDRPLDGFKFPISQLASVFPIGKPLSYKFFATYDYGAKVVLADVLKGELSAKAKVKFAWFSRTWRKRLVKFNGWTKTFELLKGEDNVDIFTIPLGSRTKVASNQAEMGLAEAQLPIVLLQPLAMPATDDGGLPLDNALPTKKFDDTDVEKLFYDGFCCADIGAPCGEEMPCCGNLTCGQRGFCFSDT